MKKICLNFILFLFTVFPLLGVSCNGGEGADPLSDQPGQNDQPDTPPQNDTLPPIGNDDYEVWVNGVKAQVYSARVQDPPFEPWKTGLNHGGTYFFASFDIDEPVNVRIRTLKKYLGYSILRPDNSKVKNLKTSPNEVSFVIEEPVKLSIEPNGKNNPLLIFANSPDDFVPDLNDPNLIYFGPGVHRPNEALIDLKYANDKTVYLAEGAIVYAGIHLHHSNNITIRGRGILSGNEFVRGEFTRNLILIEGSNNVIIKDLVLQGSPTWTIPFWNSTSITIDNVKILGSRVQNDDGINPVNSSDVRISNCFIRTDDDCIALKGTMSEGRDVERITVENSILWCDRARIFLLGHESRAQYMRDIVYRNIDIIHFSMTPFLLEPGEEMRLQNVDFENIRINGEGQNSLIRLKPTVIDAYMQNKVPGYISDVSFNNIRVTGKSGNYSVEVRGADEQHNVSDVTMSDVFILNEKLSPSYKNLIIGDYVYNFKIK